MGGSTDRWNLNIHYHRVVLDVVPSGGGRALDVGCGDGLLAFDLARVGMEVVGIDSHLPSIDRAAADPLAGERTTFVCGDVFTHLFEPGSFDLVASSAMLHHVDARAGLRRMRELVRPRGVVAVVGFARPARPIDHVLAVAGAAFRRFHVARGTYWEHNAPISRPPPLTTNEMATLGANELPGSVFRPLMSNRFSLIWQAPD